MTTHDAVGIPCMLIQLSEKKPGEWSIISEEVYRDNELDTYVDSMVLSQNKVLVVL